MTAHPSSNGTSAHPSLDAALIQSATDLNQDILDALPLSVLVYEAPDEQTFRIGAINRTALRMGGYTTSIVGERIIDLLSPDEAAQNTERLLRCFTTNTAFNCEERYTVPNGTLWFETRFIPFPSATRPHPRVLTVASDITERKQRELAEREHQEALITHQAATLAELSTPLLAISDTTVVMPLIGTIDTRRVSHIMDTLLSGVAAAHAAYVILDITGVQVVDTQVASAFLRAAQAVQLLGATLILTGIRPEVAQTIVGLGTDLQGIVTRGSLQSGIAYTMGRETSR